MIGNVGAYFDVLSYQSTTKLAIGVIVSVPVGKKTSLGIVIKAVAKPDFECKEIIKQVVEQPLPSHLIKLHSWLSDYYATSSGVTWQTIIPARVGVKPRLTEGITPNKAERTQKLLNDQQLAAINQITSVDTGTFLVHGITGSGKTEIYKAVVQQAIAAGNSAIILVPEISLTTQLVNDFRQQFDNVVVTHSAMTDSERNRIWRQVISTTKPIVVIGPRSALFMPVAKLGTVVIDECHEPTYKQDASPRYHTITVAAKLRQLCNSKLILGSATPSINDYYLAKHFNRPIITLNKLAVQDAKPPLTEIVDLTNRDNFTMESKLFTTPLLTAMREALSNKRQILLFHNRRGTANLAICESCGYTATCPTCYVPMTLHGDQFKLICHICGHKEKPPLTCPECHQPSMVYKGIGTKRIEEEVCRLFPRATVRRFDGDTAKGEAVHDVYNELQNGTTDIIIGTQTIAKGLNLPKLAVVGIVQADAGLSMPDFSASERTFQLIAQACGRVGRNNQTTTAIVQTYQPEAPAVVYGVKQDYLAFYEQEIKNRQSGHFPPFAHLLKLSCAYKTERGAVVAASKLANKLRSDYGETIKILGPAPSFYERMRGLYRWQIIIRSSQRKVLCDIASQINTAGNWQVELDPISLL